MDVVLDWADNYVLDDVYSKIPLTAEWSRDFWVRQSVSLVSIVAFYGYIFYLSFAGFSYLAYFDKTQMKHPKFLKNQVSLLLLAFNILPFIFNRSVRKFSCL